MKRFRTALLALLSIVSLGTICAPLRANPSMPVEGFVAVNGVRLQYLDFGGSGPALILIHGLADNPRVFDDLAPAFTGAFHVIAYARRGSGDSDVTGPYDVDTLTEDLRGLMDALGIARADLVGYSAGGDEITQMAARHPDRVRRLVYFEGGYDWADPDFKAFIEALPPRSFDPPASAMTSLGAYRSYLRTSTYPDLDDLDRIEANFRNKVLIQRDGSLVYRTSGELLTTLYRAMWSNKPREYARVRSPALAIYADDLYDLRIADVQRRETLRGYQERYWKPFREKSIEHIQHDLAHVRIVRVPGSHSNFFLTSRKAVVDSMRAFLESPAEPERAAGAVGPRFEISFPAAVHPQAITGRLFLMISQTNEPEVRLQSTWFNSPQITAVDVKALQAAQTIVIDGAALGTPLPHLTELPAGDYYVQAVLNLYTQAHRADGRVLWVHMDQWEGQQFNKSPGNLYSEVSKLHVEPSGSYRLSLSEVISPVQVPPDTQWVKHVRIQSQILSKFWGQPIYVGAVVLLPRNYGDRRDVQYPVLYHPSGHFTLDAPYGFRTEPGPPELESDRRERLRAGYETGYEFYQSWSSEHFPRMILVSLLDPTPLSDWSGGVNSVNTGPYADAIVKELIPYIETHFRIIREPYARLISGRDSSGREALALQLQHPELFGSAWIFQPWAFTFEHYFSLDIYHKDNAFVLSRTDVSWWTRTQSEWTPVERQIARLADGTAVIATFRQLSQHDAVMAGMAGGDCLGADDAILGPVGEDGYPRRLWDRVTGKIDREVADYWRDHGDLVHYAQENWSRIGPQLRGKLHLYVGEMDHFERNYGVHAFEDFLHTTQNPHEPGAFEFAPTRGDFQPMTNAGLVRILTDSIAKAAPGKADTRWQSD